MTPRQIRLLGWLAAHLMRLLLGSLRYEIIDRARVLATPPERPLLWAFWHNRLLIMGYAFQRFFPGRPGAALTSVSKDGEIISSILAEFGIRSVRGSSSRGGARALVEMKRVLAGGSVMAVTPDGPRGPCYFVNPGIIKLAQITEGHILPVRVTYSHCWRLRSWDGFMVPWPFARVRIIFDELHRVAPTATDAEFEAERVRFEQSFRPVDGE